MQQKQRQIYDSSSLSDIVHNPLFNQVPDAIIIADTQGRYIGLNQHACTLLGYQREELLKFSWHDLLFANDLAQAPLSWHDLYIGETLCEERRIRSKAGHILHVEINICKLADGSILTFVRDITEHKFLETMLHERAAFETRLTKIVNAMPGAICSLRLQHDGLHTISYANAPFQEILGLQLVDLMLNDAPLFAHIHPADRTSVQQAIAHAAVDLTPLQFEYRIQHPETGERWIELHATPTQEPNGSMVWYGLLQDRTDHKHNQERLSYQQNMESLSRLVGSVAHHFNNLLTPIRGYCDLIQDQLPPNSPIQDDLHMIMRASDRTALLTRQLLAFGRKQQLVPHTLDLNTLLTDVWGQLEHLFSTDCTFELDLQPDIWTVVADADQIAQICTDIMLNARDAMAAGSRLSVKTRNVAGDDWDLPMQLGIPHAPYVLVTITDTGHGMDAQTLSQSFAPFFTTKDPFQHMGLGLATVYGIIHQSGGNIAVNSREGEGTTFAFYLPRSKGAPATGLPYQLPDPTPDLQKRVLVVEDDPQVRRLIQKIIAKLNYTVLVASSVEEALTLVETYPQSIDLLVTDAIIPNMSALTLVESIKQHNPDIKILLLSDYADASLRYERVLASEVALLSKPFSPNTLVAKIREILGTT